MLLPLACLKRYFLKVLQIERLFVTLYGLKGPPHVGRSNIAVPSIYKEVHASFGGCTPGMLGGPKIGGGGQVVIGGHNLPPMD